MKKIIGLVGYACNGKSTILKNVMSQKQDYKLFDFANIYYNEAIKNGYNGVTEWYTKVGLEEYKKRCVDALYEYIDSIPDDVNIIIDDIFDIDVLNYMIKKFPNIKLIGINSKYEDRIERLGLRRNIQNPDEKAEGIKLRDDMKKYCGIEEVLLECNKYIDNTGTIDEASSKLLKEMNKAFIICILGYTSAGKSTIDTFISESLKIPCLRYGNVLKEFVREAGFNRPSSYISERGIKDYVSYTNKYMKEYIDNYIQNNKIFLIDGLVSNEIFNHLKEHNDLVSIYLKVDDEVRKKRLSSRENINMLESQKELEKKDTIKTASGLDMIISKSDYIINGNVSKNEIYKEMKKILKRRDFYEK